LIVLVVTILKFFITVIFSLIRIKDLT